MKPKSPSRYQGGMAAVEFAILLAVLTPLLTVPIFIGKYYWHYTAIHKAAHDAARYLSTMSEKEMRSGPLARAAGRIAEGIAEEEVADLAPGMAPPTVEVFCGPGKPCDGVDSGPLPETVQVRVEADMFDTLFGAVPTGSGGFPISVLVEVRYVGQ